MAPQRDNRVTISALLRAGHKVSEVANLVGESCTTVYAIKKRMHDGEVANRCVGGGQNTVVVRDSFRGVFEAVSERPCANIQGNLGLERTARRG